MLRSGANVPFSHSYNKVRYLAISMLLMLVIFYLQSICFAAYPPNHSSQSSDQQFKFIYEMSEESSSVTSVMQKNAVLILDSIIDRNVKKINNIDLIELRERINRVRWRLYRGSSIAAGPLLTRSTAMYDVKNNLVVFSLIEWNQSPPEFRSLIALHESLGALGIDDHNYQISILLSVYSTVVNIDDFVNQQQKELILPFLSDFLAKKIPVAFILASGRGVTGVGGGGDYLAAGYKFVMVSAFCIYGLKTALNHNQIIQVMEHILQGQVEPKTKERTETVFSKDWENFVVAYNKTDKRLSVLVPNDPNLLLLMGKGDRYGGSVLGKVLGMIVNAIPK